MSHVEFVMYVEHNMEPANYVLSALCPLGLSYIRSRNVFCVTGGYTFCGWTNAKTQRIVYGGIQEEPV